MKLIVAIWHSAEKGKSQSILEFAIALLRAFPRHSIVQGTVPASGEVRVVVDANGKRVGIDSQGDPNTQLRKRLDDLAKLNCDILVCSTRTRRETVWDVEHIADTYGYDIIWTSTYQPTDPSLFSVLNRAKGLHILETLRTIGAI